MKRSKSLPPFRDREKRIFDEKATPEPRSSPKENPPGNTTKRESNR
jgi:hypothetical protein